MVGEGKVGGKGRKRRAAYRRVWYKEVEEEANRVDSGVSLNSELIRVVRYAERACCCPGVGFY
jgi:hypothetical protein